MEKLNDFPVSVQETSRETHLSTEETIQGAKHVVSQTNNAGSEYLLQWDSFVSYIRQEAKENITFSGDCAIEDHGPDNNNSMGEEQDNIYISCMNQSSLCEVFEDNSKETDIKSAKSKIVDATCPNDNSSISCHQDSNFFRAIRSDNHSSMSYTPMNSEDRTTAQLVEDDRALRDDGTTELSGVEQNAKEASMPSVNIQGHNDVSNMCSTTDDPDGNVSPLNPDDDTNTDACTTTAANKQQAGGNMCEGRAIDSESGRSAGLGENVTELLHPAPSIKEADVKEKRNKVVNDITNDNSSTDLHLQDTSITKIISPDNNSPMILKTEDSSTAGNEKNNCSSESQRSNNITTKHFESEHIDDDFRYSHEVNKNLPTANDTGKDAFSINNDDSTNIKVSNISASSNLQGGGDLDTMEPENKMSIENRSNNESSCREPNTAKDDITAAYEENKISPEFHTPNNRPVELFGSGHNGNVGNRLTDEVHIYSKDSHTVKIDSSITNELKIGASAIDEGRNEDLTRRETSTACLESDKNALIVPEDKTSIGHGKISNKFSYPEPKIRETDVNKGKGKTYDATSPNSISSTQDVITPVDHPTQSCISNITLEGSTILRLIAEVPRSKKHRKKAKQISKVNCRPNDEKQATNRVTGATKTDGNGSIDGCNQTANISKTNTGTSSDAHTGRRRRKRCFKSDATTISQDLEDTTSSRDGGENPVLSFLNPKSQDQSQTAEKKSIVSDTTSSPCFQKHGNVSTAETRAQEKSWNVIRGFRNTFTIGLLLTLTMVNPVQAPPVQSQWQQLWSWKTAESLMNQSLTIKNMDNNALPGCMFSFTSLPFSHNCPELRAFVKGINETYIEMRTNNLTAEKWTLEYGQGWNGKTLLATRGEFQNVGPVEGNTSEYNSSHNSFPHKNETEDKTQNNDENKTKNRDYTWLIAILAPFLIAGCIFLVLWYCCPTFKSWVKSCRRSGNKKDPDSNLDSNTNPSDTPLTSAPIQNGNLKKHDDKNDDDGDDEESQRLNPESSEEPHPDTSET